MKETTMATEYEDAKRASRYLAERTSLSNARVKLSLLMRYNAPSGAEG